MDRPHLVLDLIDDHNRANPMLTRDVIGVYVAAERLPVIVSCGTEAPFGVRQIGPLSLNEVMCTEGVIDGNPHQPHLTTRSVMVLTEKQRNMLLDNGFLDLGVGCYVEVFSARPLEEIL